MAILSGYIQLSVIISMPLAGFLCDKCILPKFKFNFIKICFPNLVGWPSVFFVHSALGLILTALWAFFYRDDPLDHPWLSDQELAIIRLGKANLPQGHSRVSESLEKYWQFVNPGIYYMLAY